MWSISSGEKLRDFILKPKNEIDYLFVCLFINLFFYFQNLHMYCIVLLNIETNVGLRFKKTTKNQKKPQTKTTTTTTKKTKQKKNTQSKATPQKPKPKKTLISTPKYFC